MEIKQKIPWQIKLICSIFLSFMPYSYNLMRRFNIGRAGLMDVPEKAFLNFMRNFQYTSNLKDFSCLELGPGDSLFSAIVAKACGSIKTYLIDVDDLAIKNLKYYQKMVDYLLKLRYSIPKLNGINNIYEFLKLYNSIYLNKGLNSLRQIPDKSIDFIWSKSVLEHVHLNEFNNLIRELRRIIKSNGVCSHGIDLRDHLSYSLNHLRVPNKIWESFIIKHSRIYTNRLRFSEIVKIFEKNGFKIKNCFIIKWKRLPISKNKIIKKFKKFSEKELIMAICNIVLIAL